MQRQKEEIRKVILVQAGQLFLQKGFVATSMRDIARNAGIGVSNIYNYFPGKDEIFCELLKPLINRLNSIIYDHDVEKIDMDMFSVINRQREIEQYVDLAERFRTPLKLLLFHSQGSSLAGFRQTYRQKMLDTIRIFMKDLKERHPELNVQITESFIGLNTSWLFTLLEELVMHHIKKDDIGRFITEYISFEMAGWKELMHA